MIYEIYDSLGFLIAIFTWKNDSWNLEWEEKKDKIIEDYWEGIYYFEEDNVHSKGTFHDDKRKGSRKIEDLSQFGYTVFLTEWPTEKELEEFKKK